MILQLEDSNSKIYIPTGENTGWNVDPKFFDKLNDYEFSGVISEAMAFNNIDLPLFIAARDIRRQKIGLPKTNFQQIEMSGKFGDWLKQAGKKIENFFKPSESTQPVAITLPDGQVTYLNAPFKKESAFNTILKGVAGAFGLYTPPVDPSTLPQPTNPMKYILPVAVVGIGGLIAYKLLSKK